MDCFNNVVYSKTDINKSSNVSILLMGKVKSHNPKLTKKYLPFVSICTPTFNRRPFSEMMFQCFRHQDYPKDRMEWIIVDDGTDKIKDLVDAANIPQIKYYAIDKQMNLGEKRNFMHTKAKGSIIVYMDDDDYYPPERVSHAVERLMDNREALCAGSSELYIYFKHIHKMVQCGPYGPNHATAGTFAFRASLLDHTKYEDHAALAEEKAFLKNYTIPFVQLDPLKTILVFSHVHNTFDKKRLLENPHPDYLKESDKTIDMFVKGPYATDIKRFFLEEIDDKLAKYPPGQPVMKPEVLRQTKQIEEDRRKQHEQQFLQQQQQQQQPQQPQQQGLGMPPQGGGVPSIMQHRPGQDPIPLSPQQVVELLQNLQNENDMFRKKVSELENMIQQLQRMDIQKTSAPSSFVPPSVPQPAASSSSLDTKSKSQPEIHIQL